ncbi:MAG: hypothetical protein IPK00_19560 [Deltaproteobacteria bacterium]|nr:hypothetical protein [Deltaproteobacteria bacterium]
MIGAIGLSLVPLAAAEAACTPPDCSLDFGSSGAYVTFGSAPTSASRFTIETWFRRDGTGASVSTGTGGVTAIPLITKGRGEADGNNPRHELVPRHSSFGRRARRRLRRGAAGATPGLNHPVAGTTPVTTGVWSHAAASYDGTTGASI